MELEKDARLVEFARMDLTIQEAIELLVDLYWDIYRVTQSGINNGLCEDFAWALCDLIKGAEAHWGDELVDADDRDDVDNVELYAYHCFVVYEGRAYDSEEPLGVDNFRELPLYLRGIP